MEKLTKEQIFLQFPDSWVLIGNPILESPKISAPLKDKLLSGIVLYASKDKREVAYKAASVKGDCTFTVCIYTGQINRKRYYLL